MKIKRIEEKYRKKQKENIYKEIEKWKMKKNIEKVQQIN